MLRAGYVYFHLLSILSINLLTPLSLASDICGGSNRMSLYRLSSGTSSSSPAPSSSVTASSTSRASTSSTSATATSASSPPSATWTYVGCVAEGTTGSRRALTGPSYTRSDMTPALCQSLCTGYDYSGTENGYVLLHLREKTTTLTLSSDRNVSLPVDYDISN